MNKPTAKKLIESAPEHILNMDRGSCLLEAGNLAGIIRLDRLSDPSIHFLQILEKFKIAIDWVGDECVCYPFQNVHTPTLGEQATLLSISDRNPRIAIAKAVIWQQEVLAKSN